MFQSSFYDIFGSEGISGNLRIMILIGSYERGGYINLRYTIMERMDFKIEEIGEDKFYGYAEMGGKGPAGVYSGRP